MGKTRKNKNKISSVEDLMESQGWQEFVFRTEKRGLYEYLSTCSFPGLGYFHFFEDVLGFSRFRRLCPLTLSINENFAKICLSFLGEIKDDDIDYPPFLSSSLCGRYCVAQMTLAEIMWPTRINLLNDFFDILIKYNFGPDIREFYFDCLSDYYNFSGLNRRKNIITKKTISGSFVLDFSQIIASFRDKPIISWFCGFTKTFQKGLDKRWEAIIDNIKKEFNESLDDEFGKPDSEPVFDVDSLLELNLSLFVDVRLESILGERGIFILNDIIFLSREKLSCIPGIGAVSINKIERFLKEFGLNFAMTEESVRDWIKNNRNRKFKIKILDC